MIHKQKSGHRGRGKPKSTPAIEASVGTKKRGPGRPRIHPKVDPPPKFVPAECNAYELANAIERAEADDDHELAQSLLEVLRQMATRPPQPRPSRATDDDDED